MENLIVEFAQFDPVTLAWMAAPKVISGIRSLWKGANPIKRKRSGEETEYRKRLFDRSKKGIYDEGNMREILSGMSRRVGEAARVGKQATMGQLTRQGLENSAVAPEMVAGIDRGLAVSVSESARDLETKNIGEKIKAQNQMGELGFKDTDEMFRSKMQQRKDFDAGYSSLVGGVTDYATGRRGHMPNQPPGTQWNKPSGDAFTGNIPSFTENSRTEIWEWLRKQKDPESALQMLLLMSGME